MDLMPKSILYGAIFLGLQRVDIMLIDLSEILEIRFPSIGFI